MACSTLTIQIITVGTISRSRLAYKTQVTSRPLATLMLKTAMLPFLWELLRPGVNKKQFSRKFQNRDIIAVSPGVERTPLSTCYLLLPSPSALIRNYLKRAPAAQWAAFLFLSGTFLPYIFSTRYTGPLCLSHWIIYLQVVILPTFLQTSCCIILRDSA